jgi:hypothetical protein
MPQGQKSTLPDHRARFGIFSMLFACCSAEFRLGAAALIGCFLRYKKNVKESPMEYGGRGLAIGGIVTGVDWIINLTWVILLVIISG